MKGSNSIPVPDSREFQVDGRPTTNYEGIVLAFTRRAAGDSDAEIARALNAAGYRTTGNRGRNLFSKDTVSPMLQNRFYVGELPDGMGGWEADGAD